MNIHPQFKTVKLKVNFGINVVGDVCGLPEKFARELVLHDYAEPIGWDLKGNGKDQEIEIAEVAPAKKKRTRNQ